MGQIFATSCRQVISISYISLWRDCTIRRAFLYLAYCYPNFGYLLGEARTKRGGSTTFFAFSINLNLFVSRPFITLWLLFANWMKVCPFAEHFNYWAVQVRRMPLSWLLWGFELLLLFRVLNFSHFRFFILFLLGSPKRAVHRLVIMTHIIVHHSTYYSMYIIPATHKTDNWKCFSNVFPIPLRAFSLFRFSHSFLSKCRRVENVSDGFCVMPSDRKWRFVTCHICIVSSRAKKKRKEIAKIRQK